MVVDLFKNLHDEYIAATSLRVTVIWYNINHANVQYEPGADEIPF